MRAPSRSRNSLSEGTQLGLFAGSRVVLLSREQLQDLMRADLAGLDLVAELIPERRHAAVAEAP